MSAPSVKHIAASDIPGLGQAMLGGYFGGVYHLNGEERALVVAPRENEFPAQWWDRPGARANVRAAKSYIDGMANTKAMAEAGSAVAARVLGMLIGGETGWHIPARDELLILQVNLLQVERFQRFGEQAFSGASCSAEYWSSTQKASGNAWCLHLLPWCTPSTNWTFKEKWVRPVKSLPIIREPNAKDLAGSGSIVGHIPVVRHTADQLQAILERFINEDSGRFYGRTADLAIELAAIQAGGAAC